MVNHSFSMILLRNLMTLCKLVLTNRFGFCDTWRLVPADASLLEEEKDLEKNQPREPDCECGLCVFVRPHCQRWLFYPLVLLLVPLKLEKVHV